jgi:hypothetical protein
MARIVQASGLSPIFAEAVLRRAVVRAGVDPESMQRKDLDKAMPEIERALVVYLGEDSARDRLGKIRDMAA